MPQLGNWNPRRGLELKRREDGRYSAEANMPRGGKAEFKICDRSWRRVEKDAEGSCL